MDEKKLELERTYESIAALAAERCYKDASFRKAFQADPKGMVETMIGESLPEDVEIIACRNDEKHWYIPVPTLEDDAELSEEELTDVSAGCPGNRNVFGQLKDRRARRMEERMMSWTFDNAEWSKMLKAYNAQKK